MELDALVSLAQAEEAASVQRGLGGVVMTLGGRFRDGTSDGLDRDGADPALLGRVLDGLRSI